jgi:hemoglobin-like flavoprotein
MDINDLNLFRESLARVTAKDGFFDSFYDRFLQQSNEISAIFQKRDMAQIKDKLRSTLEMVALSAEGQPGLSLYMEMLGRTHQRLNVSHHHFYMWQAALLETVAAYDPDYNERIRVAWSHVIGTVIRRIIGAPQPHKAAI